MSASNSNNNYHSNDHILLPSSSITCRHVT